MWLKNLTNYGFDAMNSVANIKRYGLIRCSTHCPCYNLLIKTYMNKKEKDKNIQKEISIHKLKQRECENYKFFIITEFINLLKS